MKQDFAKFDKKPARGNLNRLMAARVPGLSPVGSYQQPVGNYQKPVQNPQENQQQQDQNSQNQHPHSPLPKTRPKNGPKRSLGVNSIYPKRPLFTKRPLLKRPTRFTAYRSSTAPTKLLAESQVGVEVPLNR